MESGRKKEPRLWAIEGTFVGRSRRGRVTYELVPEGGRTHFARIFDYPTPGFLFVAADRLVLRRRVESESRDAVQRLAEILSAR